jgi:carbamoyltransferase
VTYILGISALYHDSAAALIHDGVVVAASSEERFSRIKHDASMPLLAARWCLAQAGLQSSDLDHVVYYEKPLRKFERLVLNHLREFPRGLTSFRRSMMAWLTEKLWIRDALAIGLCVQPGKILFSDHHLSHAASAFYCSPFDEAAVLTVDGVGEHATTGLFRGTSKGLERLAEIHFPHSIGLIYSVFTSFLGFQVNDGEYKVMGMAAYGQPRYKDKVERILRGRSDGSFDVDTSYVAYHRKAEESYNGRFVELFGDPRKPGAPFDPADPQSKHYADIAASIQAVTEDRVVELARELRRRTGLDDLCMAGGVALNGVANYQVLMRSGFKRLFVHPAAGDAGGAVGAALWAWHEVLGGARSPALASSALGQSWTDGQISQLLRDLHLPHTTVEGESLLDQATDDLKDGKVIGWFQGAFEWGPRALGQRSILADARQRGMNDRINAKVKFREPFRPFAPSVLAGSEERYFALPGGASLTCPWMLMVAPVTDGGRDRLPATTHVDGSSRVHVVSPDANPLYSRLLERFGQASGDPVLLNTSFNLKGEPIVASPFHALATFEKTDLDVLYLGSFRVENFASRRSGHA